MYKQKFKESLACLQVVESQKQKPLIFRLPQSPKRLEMAG